MSRKPFPNGLYETTTTTTTTKVSMMIIIIITYIKTRRSSRTFIRLNENPSAFDVILVFAPTHTQHCEIRTRQKEEEEFNYTQLGGEGEGCLEQSVNYRTRALPKTVVN